MNHVHRTVLCGAIAMSCFAAVSSPAMAVGSFTINDGNAQFAIGNLTGNRVTGVGGSADLITQNALSDQIDHMFQNFFWYRGPGDTREYAISNQTFSNVFGNHANLTYVEPFNDGATPNALQVSL